MKLKFFKTESNEISLQIQRGTTFEDFSYIEMVSQLLQDNTFEDTDFGNLSEDEKEKIQKMLDKINNIFQEDEIKE